MQWEWLCTNRPSPAPSRTPGPPIPRAPGKPFPDQINLVHDNEQALVDVLDQVRTQASEAFQNISFLGNTWAGLAAGKGLHGVPDGLTPENSTSRGRAIGARP